MKVHDKYYTEQHKQNMKAFREWAKSLSKFWMYSFSVTKDMSGDGYRVVIRYRPR